MAASYFVEKDGGIMLVKEDEPDFSQFVGIATDKALRTDQWLDETRERR